jgi:ElaB/YqjD/DUF883 family membrane-anchored ribosome-binding protein
MESNTMGTQKQNLDRMSQSAHQAVERATQTAQSLAEQMYAKGDELMSAKEEWVEATRVYVREHPMQAIGIALAAGYLLSMLTRWSR